MIIFTLHLYFLPLLFREAINRLTEVNNQLQKKVKMLEKAVQSSVANFDESKKKMEKSPPQRMYFLEQPEGPYKVDVELNHRNEQLIKLNVKVKV